MSPKAKTRALAALATALLAGSASCRQILGVGGVTFTGGTGGAGGASTSTTGTVSTSSTGTGGGACTNGQTQPCYTGPTGTEGFGPCKGGTQSCSNGTWGACTGEVTPQPQDCAATVDVDCLGSPVPCSGTPVWAEAFGAADADFVNAVAVDSQGNVIVTGGFSNTVNFADPAASAQVTRTAYADGNADIFVAKYTGAGKLMWVQVYGGPVGDAGTGVAVDSNDDILVVGYFYSSVTFGPSMTPAQGTDVDAFVVKLKGADGSTLWANTYGDATPTNATTQRADAVAVDANGNVAVVGYFNDSISFGGAGTLSSSGAMDYDAYVLMLDSMGNYMWSQDVHGDPGAFDALRGVACDGLGDVVVTGVATGSQVTFGTGLLEVTPVSGGTYNHVVVGKYSSGGTPLWGQALGNDNAPTPTQPRHLGRGIAADANGDVVVTGAFVAGMQFPDGSMLTAKGATDIFVAKLDAAGNATWSESFAGSGGTSVDAADAVALDQFGNVVLAGSYQGLLDVLGSTLKAKGTMDAFAIKLDPTGKPLWAQGFAAAVNSTAYARGVAVVGEPTYMPNVSASDPVVVGQFGVNKGDTIDFDLSSGPLSSAGGSDMFIAHLAP